MEVVPVGLNRLKKMTLTRFGMAYAKEDGKQ